MKKVVTYARVSTLDQDTDRQLEITKKHCIDNNYEIVQHFEEKISGKKDKSERQILSDMLDFVMDKDNQISAVVIVEVARLGRNLIDVLTNVKALMKHGISVIAIQNNIDTLNDDGTENYNSTLLLGVLGSVAEIERKRIVTNSRTGLRNKIVEHKHAFGGVAPYGYIRVDKMFVVNEKESELVKLVFNLYDVDGFGCKKIAEILNKSDYQTRFQQLKKNVKYKGNRVVNSDNVIFSDRVVYSMLKNQLYKGIRVYEEKNSNNEVIETHYIEQPSIVSVEQFDRVQEKLNNRNNKIDSNVEFNYIIEKGIIKCGICGKNYFSHMRKSGKDSAYKCMSTRGIEGNCGNTNISINKLTSSIWYFLKRTKEMQAQLEETKNNSTLKTDIELLKTDVLSLNNEIEKQSKFKKKLLNFLLDGTIEKDEFSTKKNECDSIINKVNKEIQSTTNKIESLIEFDKNLDDLDDLNEILRNIKETPSELQKVFKKLVRMIKIYPVSECINHNQKVFGIDKTLCVNLFLYTGIKPIEFLITQRTDLIIPLNQFEFDYTNHSLNSDFKINNNNKRKILFPVKVGLK